MEGNGASSKVATNGRLFPSSFARLIGKHARVCFVKKKKKKKCMKKKAPQIRWINRSSNPAERSPSLSEQRRNQNCRYTRYRTFKYVD